MAGPAVLERQVIPLSSRVAMAVEKSCLSCKTSWRSKHSCPGKPQQAKEN